MQGQLEEQKNKSIQKKQMEMKHNYTKMAAQNQKLS